MTDDYKQKYDDLMQRCEEFNIWFEDHKRRANNFPGTTIFPTTTPWPPGSLSRNICTGCGQDLSKLTHYVCHMPTCPSQIRWSSVTTKDSTT